VFIKLEVICSKSEVSKARYYVLYRVSVSLFTGLLQVKSQL